MKGKVSLVGAGPGDPGLLTLKALQCLREADLIIYDYLANPQHLRHARKSAIKIGVGKGFRHIRLSQERINRLIIRATKRGWRVVRLKGGDPYLFGRGGEEALFLQRHRIPFEVVPGVTSAIACAAYAGIPLTHRAHNSAVTFLTGHKAHDEKLDSIRWEKIVGLGGTIVIYMGFYNLAKIAGRLIRAGMPASMPAAVIEWGTLPSQKSCEGNLRTIAARVLRQKLKAPCIIVIGEVVCLRKKLNWFERLPLFGKKVVITRAHDKASLLADKLSELGAQVMELPAFRIEPPSDYADMDRAIRDLDDVDWLVFTSAYGVESFFDRLRTKHGKDARALGQTRVAVVGPETGRSLETYGIIPDLQPRRFQTSALVDAFKRNVLSVRGKRLLLLRTHIAGTGLEEALRKLGARVRRVTAYKTKMPKKAPADVRAALRRGEVHFVTFTSSSTVTHFIRLLGARRARKIARHTKFASIGPVTSKTLRDHGFRPACQAKIFTLDGLIEAILSFRASPSTSLRVNSASEKSHPPLRKVRGFKFRS